MLTHTRVRSNSSSLSLDPEVPLRLCASRDKQACARTCDMLPSESGFTDLQRTRHPSMPKTQHSPHLSEFESSIHTSFAISSQTHTANQTAHRGTHRHPHTTTRIEGASMCICMYARTECNIHIRLPPPAYRRPASSAAAPGK